MGGRTKQTRAQKVYLEAERRQGDFKDRGEVITSHKKN
jgi:hypothetical protein